MQTARMLGGLTIVLGWAWAARAQPITETIKVPEVMVRSGPSPELYATTKLRKGDTVRVLREEYTGWLAIVPPPGSFSWIDTRLVERIGTNAAVVSVPEAPIWVGSRLVNVEPTVSRTRAVKGTQLTVIGRPERARDGMRLPIVPVPSEVRYLPAEAVRASAAPQPFVAAAPEPMKPASAPASPSFTSPQPGATGSTASPPAAPVTAASAPPVPSSPSNSPNSLWRQAEEAESAGNLVRARELFNELAVQVQQTDYPLYARCLNRIADLQERAHNRATAQAATSGLATANAPSGWAADRLAPSPSVSSAQPPSTYRPSPRAPSEYCYVQDAGHTARLSPPVTNAPSPPAPTGQWSDLGRLRRVPFALDGKPLFCLQPIDLTKRHVYIAAGPGVNLEPYVQRTVYLYGPVVYRGDLRTDLMTAMQVRLER